MYHRMNERAAFYHIRAAKEPKDPVDRVTWQGRRFDKHCPSSPKPAKRNGGTGRTRSCRNHDSVIAFPFKSRATLHQPSSGAQERYDSSAALSPQSSLMSANQSILKCSQPCSRGCYGMGHCISLQAPLSQTSRRSEKGTQFETL